MDLTVIPDPIKWDIDWDDADQEFVIQPKWWKCDDFSLAGCGPHICTKDWATAIDIFYELNYQ